MTFDNNLYIYEKKYMNNINIIISAIGFITMLLFIAIYILNEKKSKKRDEEIKDKIIQEFKNKYHELNKLHTENSNALLNIITKGNDSIQVNIENFQKSLNINLHDNFVKQNNNINNIQNYVRNDLRNIITEIQKRDLKIDQIITNFLEEIKKLNIDDNKSRIDYQEHVKINLENFKKELVDFKKDIDNVKEEMNKKLESILNEIKTPLDLD